MNIQSHTEYGNKSQSSAQAKTVYMIGEIDKAQDLRPRKYVYWIPFFAKTSSTTFSTSALIPWPPPPSKAARTLFSTYLPTISTSILTLEPISFLLKEIFS